MKNQYDLGIFDSGIGGLTIAYAFLHRHSNMRILYYADNAFLPFGNKSSEVILGRTEKAFRFFSDHNCSSALLACNTASTVCMQNNYDWNENGMLVYNVIDTLMESGAVKNYEKILLLSTEASKSSGVFEQRLEELKSKEYQVLNASELVPLIEERNSFQEDKIREYLLDLKREVDFQADAIFLGCTHFPLIRHLFREVFGREVKLQDAIIPTIESLQDKVKASSEDVAKMDIHCTAGDSDGLVEHYVKIDAYESAFV